MGWERCYALYSGVLEAKLILSRTEIHAIIRLAEAIGYISHETHHDFHDLLKRLRSWEKRHV